MEIGVEVHEEDDLVLLVSDGLTHGLELDPGSLEGLVVEVNRLGGVLGGGVKGSPGLNPRRHGGGLEEPDGEVVQQTTSERPCWPSSYACQT